MLRIISNILGVVFYCITLHGQYSIDDFQKFTKKNGLSHSSIRDIMQDERGYIWITTESGLNRFDGHQFEVFYPPQHSLSKSSNFIAFSSYIGTNKIALGTTKGAFIFNTVSYTFLPLQIPSERIMDYWAQSVRSIKADKYGNVGVSTGTGFYVYDEEGHLKQSKVKYTAKDIKSDWLTYGGNIIINTDGHMNQESDDGINFYDPKSNAITLTSFDPEKKCNSDALLASKVHVFRKRTDQKTILHISQYSSDETATVLNSDKTGLVDWYSKFIALNDSTILWNATKGIMKVQYDSSSRSYDASNAVMLPEVEAFTIFIDKDKRLWLGTRDGLLMQKGIASPIPIKKITLKEEEKVANRYLQILRHENFYIVGGKNITIFDILKNKVVKNISSPKKLKADDRINTFVALNDYEILVDYHQDDYLLDLRTFSFKIWKFNNLRKNTFIVNSYKDKNSDLWLSFNQNNSILKYSKKEDKVYELSGYFENFCCGVFSERSDGKMVVNAESNYLVDMQRLLILEKIKKPIFLPEYVNVYGEFHNDSLQTYYFSRGDPMYIQQRNQTSILTEDILYPNVLSVPIFTKDGTMFYLNTSSDIVQYNSHLNTSIVYPSDLILNNENKIIKFQLYPPDNEIYLLQANTIYSFNYTTEHTKNITPLYISKIKDKVGKNIPYDMESIILSYNTNNLTIEPSVIDYNNLNIQYFYQINEDTIWSKLDKPSITFENLSPDDYTIRFKAQSLDNFLISDIKELNVILKPPYYQTWWFALLLLSLCSLLIYYAFRFYTNQLKLSQKLLESELSGLKHQINSHFLYNNLNAIKELVLSNENSLASRYISKFAALMRFHIESSAKPSILITTYLENLRHYLDMEKLRYDNLEYNITVSQYSTLNDISIPSYDHPTHL